MADNNCSPPLRLSHKNGVDEAHGALQVCALTLVHLSKSKVALGFILLVAFGFGIVDKSETLAFFNYVQQKTEKIEKHSDVLNKEPGK